MESKILILENNAAYATNLCRLIEGELGCKVVHVTGELAAVRELTTNFYHLLIAGFHQTRRRESLKLIELLLVERKIVNAPPVMVLSDDQDPATVQSIIKSGVADYLIYPSDLKTSLPRIKKVLDEQASVGGTLVRIATVFLGPAAQVFLEKQSKVHLKIQSLRDLHSDQLPYLFRHIYTTLTPILKDKVTQFKHRIEQVFGIKIENPE